MRHFITSIPFLACIFSGHALEKSIHASITDDASQQPLASDQLLPEPAKVVDGEARWIAGFHDWSTSQIEHSFSNSKGELVAALKEHGYPGEHHESAIPMRVEILKSEIAGAPEKTAHQAYQLMLKPGLLRIVAPTETAVFYAIQTLRQLLPNPGLPMREVEVTDWPAFPYRGFMHDTGRNYQEPALLKKQIEIFARYKINVFHFHFTDNPGWRLESKRHPELQSPQSFTRHHGKYYSHHEFRDIIAFARNHHMVVIPELDVPGHTAAFRRAYKIEKMESPGVRERLIDLIDELCTLAPADVMPYIHLGTDEVKPHERVPLEWLEACVAAAHRHNRTVIGWNPGIRIPSKGPMAQQLWTEKSRPWSGIPYFDSQSNYYLNHIDPFEMLTAMAFQQPCRWGSDGMKLGPIACVWHDDHARNGNDVILMNHVYPGMLLFSDNAWRGRPTDEPQWWCRFPPKDSPLFERAINLETRLLAQRDRYFENEPFPYLRQTDLEWRIIGPFDHGGNPSAIFPPETEGIQPVYFWNGKEITWWPSIIRGATHYPRHFWYPSHLNRGSGTIYAFTRIWSPQNQEVGAWIGFNAWSRSSGRSRGGHTPQAGQWNRSHAGIWINGNSISAPDWKQPGIGGGIADETPLIDEDYFYRPATKIQLRQGWNEIIVKAPHNGEWKWVFTFIPVIETGVGYNVREVPELRYSATFNEQGEQSIQRILAQSAMIDQPSADDSYGAPCMFTNAPTGPLRKLNTTHGMWSAQIGNASIIDSSHAGRRILKIEGGKSRAVEVDLLDVETIDGLSCYLHRWTRNAPFDLSIEAQADGVWRTIARLNQASMQGHVEEIRFQTIQAKALRFTLTSPDHGGLMLDHLRLRTAQAEE